MPGGKEPGSRDMASLQNLFEGDDYNPWPTTPRGEPPQRPPTTAAIATRSPPVRFAGRGATGEQIASRRAGPTPEKIYGRDRSQRESFVQSPDPKVARAAMEDAAFTRDRLKTLLPRLRTKHKEVADAEALTAWTTEANALGERRF